MRLMRSKIVCRTNVNLSDQMKSRGSRARPLSERLCPSVTGGKNGQPSAYSPQLGLMYVPSIEGCGSIGTGAGC